MLLVCQKPKEAKHPLYAIDGEQWRLRSRQSETGEWIEIPSTTPGSFELKRTDAKTTPPASQPTTTPPIPTPKP
ncbi:MAG: hypothetical protein NTY98_08790 [Verrucomicrobia bacterium]|nr:hypothetical protein [Verrucomicrobiota bacterium]